MANSHNSKFLKTEFRAFSTSGNRAITANVKKLNFVILSISLVINSIVLLNHPCSAGNWKIWATANGPKFERVKYRQI